MLWRLEMNVVNRLVTVIVLLILLALALTLAVAPVVAVQAAQQGLEGLEGFLSNAARLWSVLFVVGRIALALLAVLIFGLLIVAELRPNRPKAVAVHTDGGSSASVTTDSVARRLTWHIDQLADVISVTPEVTARGKSVNVRLDLETRPEVDVPMKTDEVVAVAREVITERMGLQIGKIDVRIKHAPYQEAA
jgi:hypothetical protein